MTSEPVPELELLARLSTTPAPIRLLMRDMGMTKQYQVREAARKLIAAGHKIKTGKVAGANEFGMWIDPASFAASYRAAMEYVDGQEVAA